jgi:hypothetical protein
MLLSLADASPKLNIQTFKGSELPAHALASLGVKLVLTKTDRNDLEHDDKILGINVYRIPSSAQRAMFFATDQIRYFSSDQIHNALRDPKYSLSSTLLLPREAAASQLQNRIAVGQNSPQVLYRRPDSDHIECTATNQHGFRIIEAWIPAGPLRSMDRWFRSYSADALMAVPITGRSKCVRVSTGGQLKLAISNKPHFAIWTRSCHERNHVDRTESRSNVAHVVLFL